MGVDNNAVLFVGLELGNTGITRAEVLEKFGLLEQQCRELQRGLSYSQLVSKPSDLWKEEAAERIRGFWCDARWDGYSTYELNDYQEPNMLFGILVGDSGSYGVATPELNAVSKAVQSFRETIGKEPRLWLFNRQY